MTDKSEVVEVIDAVAKLTDNIPIYQDLVQPAAQELGKNLGTAAKLVTVALSPVRGLVWGFDQIEAYLTKALSEKLSKIPQENIVPPPIKIAGPVFESMRFCTEERDLKDMFANLLASSMDSQSQSMAHSAYVEVIKNLSGDEAKILKYISENSIGGSAIPVIDQVAHFSSNNGQTVVFRNTSIIGVQSKCKSSSSTSIYFDNLIRLGVLLMREGELLKSGIYSDIENSDLYINNKNHILDMNNHLDETVKYVSLKKSIIVTDFGKHLIKICVQNKSV